MINESYLAIRINVASLAIRINVASLAIMINESYLAVRVNKEISDGTNTRQEKPAQIPVPLLT